MPGVLILPPQYLTVEGPLVFLAGPIQALPDWQEQAIRILREASAELHLASPAGNTSLASSTLTLRWTGNRTISDSPPVKGRSSSGWREATHHCDRAYGQTSRFELAEWKVRHERDGARLVVGIEDGFSGARYIRRRFQQDCPGVPVVSSLQAACQLAVQRGCGAGHAASLRAE